MRAFFLFFGLSTALILVLGFGGRFHGAGDTIALLRPLAVPVIAVIGMGWLLFKPRQLGVACLGLALGAGYTMVPPAPASFVPDDFRTYALYQKNLLFLLPDTTPVAEDILGSGADFVTLQELHARNRPILTRLRDTYPYQHFCPFAAVGGISVLSKWPVIEGQTVCEDFGGLSAMQVETPGGPLWVVSIHMHWPFPFRQSAQVQSLLPLLERLDGSAVVGGDFNMFEWAHSVRAVQRATETSYSGYPGGTFAFSYHNWGRNWLEHMPLLPIDHVLIPKEARRVSVARRPRLGSDHFGVVATFSLMAQ